MHFDWLKLVLSVSIPAIGAWIAHKIGTSADHAKALARAQLLTQIATEAATVIVALNPNATWAELVRDTVARIAASAGLSVSDRTAIENAATAALTALGKNPGTAPPATAP